MAIGFLMDLTLLLGPGITKGHQSQDSHIYNLFLLGTDSSAGPCRPKGSTQGKKHITTHRKVWAWLGTCFLLGIDSSPAFLWPRHVANISGT